MQRIVINPEVEGINLYGLNRHRYLDVSGLGKDANVDYTSLKRDDPVLVQIVDEGTTDLCIVEIPDDVVWRIETPTVFSGERVVESHHIWFEDRIRN